MSQLVGVVQLRRFGSDMRVYMVIARTYAMAHLGVDVVVATESN